MARRFPCAGARALWAPTRREFLYSLGASIGSVALTAMLAEHGRAWSRGERSRPTHWHPGPRLCRRRPRRASS